MKPENTIENKQKFFALYLDVDCCLAWENKSTYRLTPYDLTYYQIENRYLLLKSLSSLSNKEASNMGLAGFSRKVKDYINVLSQSEADVLRANGYAIPWRQFLTVEEMINYGWIKLKLS